MPADTTPPTDSAPAKSSHDAVALALSGVTCAVLAIGVIVIRSTMPSDDSVTSSPREQHGTHDNLISIGSPNDTKPDEYIILQPVTPDPRPLPPAENSGGENDPEFGPVPSEPTTPPFTAYRPSEIEPSR